MSNPFLSKAKSTGAAKMAHTSGSAKDFKDSRDIAKSRYAEGGAVDMPTIRDTSGAKPMTAETKKPDWMGSRTAKADGGEVEATPVPASPFEDVKPTKAPRLPRRPATPPPNKL
jgi:hypothetical protein